MSKLSVILVVRNEEKKVRKCLRSVDWADEIIVVDQSSTDRTVNICREFTDKVFIVGPKGFCEPDRELAASKARNDWILYVDADEEVSLSLKEEIASTISGRPEYKSYYIPRRNIFLGKWIRYSGWYPGYALRLFRKGHAVFPERIHRDILPEGKAGYLKNDMIHVTCDDLTEYMRKVDRYTTITAGEIRLGGETVTCKNYLSKLIFLPSAYFFKKFIIKRGFMDGIRGLLIAGLTFFTVFITYSKLWEFQRNDAKQTDK